MTYGEALKNGYKNDCVKYQNGYVSRKINPEGQKVLTAGGSKKGRKYVLLPCYKSTRYCYRQYLVEED